MLHVLDTRRSVPAKQLEAPGPDHETLLRMLRSASRVPDHGKRVPFRFLRIAGEPYTQHSFEADEAGSQRGGVTPFHPAAIVRNIIDSDRPETHLVRERVGLGTVRVTSAGTADWHVGKGADERTNRVLRDNAARHCLMSCGLRTLVTMH